jgi:hypothetical protein
LNYNLTVNTPQLCACGCGAPIPPTQNHRYTPAQFLRGHNQKLQRLPHHVYTPTPEEIPSGVCECGCGQTTPIAATTYRTIRWFRGHPKPFVPGHHARRIHQLPKLLARIRWSVANRAYLAGLIDGEGTIAFRGPLQTRRYVQVQIANNDQPLMDWLLSTFGGRVHARRRIPNCQDGFRWQIGHRLDCQRVLTAVLPYLRIKRPLAQRALALLATFPPEQMRAYHKRAPANMIKANKLARAAHTKSTKPRRRPRRADRSTAAR